MDLLVELSLLQAQTVEGYPEHVTKDEVKDCLADCFLEQLRPVVMEYIKVSYNRDKKQYEAFIDAAIDRSQSNEKILDDIHKKIKELRGLEAKIERGEKCIK